MRSARYATVTSGFWISPTCVCLCWSDIFHNRPLNSIVVWQVDWHHSTWAVGMFYYLYYIDYSLEIPWPNLLSCLKYVHGVPPPQHDYERKKFIICRFFFSSPLQDAILSSHPINVNSSILTGSLLAPLFTVTRPLQEQLVEPTSLSLGVRHFFSVSFLPVFLCSLHRV